MLAELSLRLEFGMTEIAFPGIAIPCSVSRGIRRWRSVLATGTARDHTTRVGDNVVDVVLQNVGIYHMPVHPTVAGAGLEVEDNMRMGCKSSRTAAHDAWEVFGLVNNG